MTRLTRFLTINPTYRGIWHHQPRKALAVTIPFLLITTAAVNGTLLLFRAAAHHLLDATMDRAWNVTMVLWSLACIAVAAWYYRQLTTHRRKDPR